VTLLSKRKPRPKANTRPVIETVPQPAPVRGLNFKDSLASMRPGDALVLDEVICRPSYIEVRRGRQDHATGLPATVETLMPYTSVAGAEQLFAGSGAGIYNVTASGAVGAALVAGQTSAYYSHTQVSNLAGNFLFAVNGVDNVQVYNGAVWAVSTITVMPLNTAAQVAVWKRRVWFVQKNTTRAWYLPVDAITGAAVAFDFASVFKKGGYLVALIPWSIDSGTGPDDYFLAVSSAGEVLVYKGTDPAAAATFGLVGNYYVSPPIGQRFYAALGGDVLLLTKQGLVPFSKVFQSSAVDLKSQIKSDRIQQRLSEDIAAYGSTVGWELVVYLEDNFLFIQVPAGGVGSRYQWVMSTISNAWSRFLISPAVTWGISGGNLYCGGADRTANAWIGGLDGTAGIQYIVIPAFSYFDKTLIRKRVTLGKISIQSDQPPVFATELLVDFDQTYSLGPVVALPPSGSVWDLAIWDSALWGGLIKVDSIWYSLAGLGYCVTQVIRGVQVGSVTRIIALDYVYEPGDLL
jgi:hypothetical protein